MSLRIKATLQMKSRYTSQAASGLMGLHEAASQGSLTQMKDLLNTLTVNSRDNRGWTALMRAVEHDRRECVGQLLVSGASPSLTCKLGHSAIDVGKFWNRKACVDMMLPYNDADKASHHYFTSSPLTPAAHLRSDEEDIAGLSSSQYAQFIFNHNGKPLLKVTNRTDSSGRKRESLSLWKCDQEQLQQLKSHILLEVSSERLVFLGFDGESAPMFVILLTDSLVKTVTKASADAGTDLTLMDKSNYKGLLQLAEEDASIMAQSIGLCSWLNMYQYCATCGSETVIKEAGHKRHCLNTNCASQHSVQNTSYPRTDMSIITAVSSPDGNQFLLVRPQKMYPNMYTCVSGYVEPGESLESACSREVQEETGVDLCSVRYHSSQYWPFTSVLMLGFTGVANENSQIHIDENELEDAQWFTREEVVRAITGQHKSMMIPPPQAIAHHLVKQVLLDTFDINSKQTSKL